MKFLDLLAKLGILRYGTTVGTYTSGKDRPTELQMEGVFNAERDLVGKKGARAAAKQDEKNPGGKK
jgi:hypothetical protein